VHGGDVEMHGMLINGSAAPDANGSNGSSTDMGTFSSNVRFTPKSGHGVPGDIILKGPGDFVRILGPLCSEVIACPSE
jgi:hypothetical protein